MMTTHMVWSGNSFINTAWNYPGTCICISGVKVFPRVKMVEMYMEANVSNNNI